MIPDQKNKFNDIFRKYGGVIDDVTANAGWFHFIKYNADGFLIWLKGRYPDLPKVYIDFIGSPFLNACISPRIDDCYYIGINAGTVLILIDFFEATLSSKNIFQTIGDHELESDEKKFLNIGIQTDFTSSGELVEKIGLQDNGFKHNSPVDPDRTDAIFYLTYQCIQFLVFHELGHLVRGHVDFTSKLANDFYWNELTVSTTERYYIEPLLSQTLEMDADSFAVNNSIIMAEIWIDEPERRSNQPVQYLSKFLNFFYKDWATFYRYWIYSVYAFFRICHYRNNNNENRASLSHPPPLNRIQMVLGNAATIELEYRKHTIEECVSIIIDSAFEMERAFSLVTYSDVGYDALSSYNEPSESKYNMSLVENYERIKHNLAPYSLSLKV